MNDNSLHILIVEDNPTDVLLLTETLDEVRTAKFVFTHVIRLDKALQQMQGSRFDVVLLDLGLPDSQGLDTFTRMQCEHPELPILILSGLDDDALAVQAVQDGAQDFLVKGKINGSVLARTITYAIERKRTEQKLIISEMSYRRLFEAAQDGIFLLNSETGQITDANPYLQELLGYTVTEFIGKRLWEIAPFRDKGANQAAFRTLQEKGYIRYDDLPLMTKDGKRAWVEFVSNVYEVGDTHVIQCNIRDISGRKQAEAGLHESEARKTAIFETALDCIISMDDTGRVIEWNPAAEKTFGYTRDGAIGELLADLIIPPALREDHARGLAHFVETGEGPLINNRIEVSAMRADGTEFLAELAISPVHLGERTIFTGYLRDITERTRAQADMTQMRHRYELILNSVGEGIHVFDLHGNITFENPASVVMLGWDAQELLGLPAHETIHHTGPDGTGYPKSECPIFATLQDGVERRRDNEVFWRQDGTNFPVEYLSTRIDNPQGESEGVVVSFRDISERKQAEAAKQESQRFLQATLDALASHIAVLDEEGTIVAVNKAWQQFSEENEGTAAFCAVGANYLEVCGKASGVWAEEAPAVVQGIREIIEGRHQAFCLEYPCHSPREQRWFTVCVTRFSGEGPVRVVVAHENITQRKMAEETLRASEELNRSILESSSDCIKLLDLDASVLSMNGPGMCLMEVDDFSTIEGHCWSGFWKDEAADRARAALEAAKAGGSGRFQGPCPTAKGTMKWWDVAVTPILNEQGQPVRLVSISRDITASKHAEQALQKIEQEQRNLAERLEIERSRLVAAQRVAKVGSWETDLITMTVMWSDETHRIYETDPATFRPTHQDFLDFVHPEDQAAVHEAFVRSANQHEACAVEHRVCLSDGRIKAVEERWEVVFDEQGKPIRAVGTCQDITERKQVEERIRHSEVSLATAQQMAHLGSWEWELTPHEDWHENRVHWSDEVFRIFGYVPGEVEASYDNFIRALHPDDLPQIEAVTAQALLDNNSYSLDHRVLLRDGTERIVHEQADFVFDTDGQPIRVVGTVQDITERKLAEDALRASEERFQNIVANTPGTVYQLLYHPDGTVEIPFVNEGCRVLFEMEPEALQQNPTLPNDLIHPDDLAEKTRLVLESIKSLTPWNCEWRIRLPSGKTKWVQGAARVQRLTDGSTLFDGLLMDITARKEAEEERDRFFSLSLDMLAVVSRDGYFKRLNPAFEATLGFSNAELTAVPFLEFVHPDDIAATLEGMAKLDGGIQVLGFENRYRCRDGSYKWLRWMSAPYEDLWYCVAHDITSVKQTAAALLKANDELELHVMERTAELGTVNEALRIENIEHRMTLGALRQAAEDLEQAVQELQSNEARLLQGNRLFTDLTHLRALEIGELETALQQITEAGSQVLDAERCSVWLYNEDHSAIRCLDLYETATRQHSQSLELAAHDFPAYFQALESGKVIVANDAHTHSATSEFSETYLKPLGITSMLNTAIVVGGQMAGVLCCERTGIAHHWKVDDQTFAGSAAAICALALESYERARAEAEMRQAKQEADAANLAKSEFLSRMSHELRTPLNAILGFGQILDHEDLDPLSKESVGYILKGGRHLLDLINEVLDIARVEAGHIELSLEPIALDDIVPEVCALVRPLAAERAIRLGEDTASLSHKHVLADRQRIKQVLINLLSNAIKYNREGGEVEIACGQTPNGWTFIAVRDTGPGIAPEDLSKLFTPFERLGAASSKVEGTGLGLVLSQQLVKAMGGTLNVKSVLGQGTTFTIELPQATPLQKQLEALRDGTLSVNASPEVEETYSVLCIEDNPSNLRLIEVILKRRPEITLMVAIQGSVGLDLARQHEPDLIFLDLNLPDIHGAEVLARLQQSALTRDIPVVVISADATPHQVERLRSAGASDYLTKPLNVEQFLQTIDKFLSAIPVTAIQKHRDEEEDN